MAKWHGNGNQFGVYLDQRNQESGVQERVEGMMEIHWHLAISFPSSPRHCRFNCSLLAGVIVLHGGILVKVHKRSKLGAG